MATPARFLPSLLAGALVGTTARSLANVGWVLAMRDVARVRDDLESFVHARRLGAAAGVDILRWSPVPWSLPLDTAKAGDATLFAALSFLADAAWSAVPLVVLLIAARFVRRYVAADRVVPLVASLFFLPALYAPVRRFSPALFGGRVPNAATWLVLSAIVVGAAVVSTRRYRPSGRLVAAASVLSVGLAVVAAIVAYTGTRDPHAIARGGKPPNVLLVSIDSLRADHVACYGASNPTTPTLDRLAAEGARFEHVTAPSSWTLPSHLTMLTGLPAETRRGDRGGLRARRSVATLAEVLRAAGYETAAFVGGPYLETRYGFGQGFSTYDDFTVVAGSNLDSHRGVTSPALLRIADDWLDGWHRSGTDRPFFLFWHLWDVHFDYIPPAPYDRAFDPDYAGTIDCRNYLANKAIHRGMDPRDLAHVRALYDGEIAFTDAHVGSLLRRLEAWGILDDTLVVVTADHGDEFFEHGVKGHRANLYETTLAVPLILRWPGHVPAGRVVEPPVGLVDVAPTIVALAGIDPPPAFGRLPALDAPAGRDLAPLLSEGGWTDRPLFADLHGEVGAVRSGEWKLVARFDPEGSASGVELYDLDADPGETHDLAEERAARRSELLDLLSGWRRLLRGQGLAAEVPEDEEHRKLLRSLGYVD